MWFVPIIGALHMFHLYKKNSSKTPSLEDALSLKAMEPTLF